MEIRLYSGEICVLDKQAVILRRGRGNIIVCTGGTLWITEPGRPDDIFLLTGQSHKVCSQDKTIVEGVGSGRFRIAQARETSILRRVSALLVQHAGFNLSRALQPV